MSGGAARALRLGKELAALRARPLWGVTCAPVSDASLDKLEATMLGPRGTPYEAGVFKLSIVIPERYPFEPPMVTFQTPIYHPNIDKGGRICMDLLKMPPKGTWLPTITLETLLLHLQVLLNSPNPDDPLMIDIANEFKQDRELYMSNARKFTEKYSS